MEQQQYLIDTNAIIDYLGKNLPASGMDFMNVIINAIPNVSVVNNHFLELLFLAFTKITFQDLLKRNPSKR
jgi:hypothetical protein